MPPAVLMVAPEDLGQARVLGPPGNQNRRGQSDGGQLEALFNRPETIGANKKVTSRPSFMDACCIVIETTWSGTCSRRRPVTNET